jgi:hypothetical protein
LTLRQKYFFILSVGFIILGTIIVVRAAIGRVPIAAVFGFILVALGGIRIRDFINLRRKVRDRDS